MFRFPGFKSGAANLVKREREMAMAKKPKMGIFTQIEQILFSVDDDLETIERAINVMLEYEKLASIPLFDEKMKEKFVDLKKLVRTTRRKLK